MTDTTTHRYGKPYCIPCGHGPCREEGPQFRAYKSPPETCEHPRESLTQMFQDVCDPDLVTVCNRCGLAFPGQTVEDLLVA